VDEGDEPVAEANVDYGVMSGYFVRLDVRLEALWPDGQPPGGAYGWAVLTPGEAEVLGASLLERARQAREAGRG
jgi:hypothetical protein